MFASSKFFLWRLSGSTAHFGSFHALLKSLNVASSSKCDRSEVWHTGGPGTCVLSGMFALLNIFVNFEQQPADMMLSL